MRSEEEIREWKEEHSEVTVDEDVTYTDAQVKQIIQANLEWVLEDGE